MSTMHPYWSYGPDHGLPPVDALAEGRRALALDLALRWEGTDEATVQRAAKYEAFLKGESVEDANGAPLDGRS